MTGKGRVIDTRDLPREGSFVVTTSEDGEPSLFRVRRNELVPERVPAEVVRRVAGLLPLRDLARRLVEIEAAGRDQREISAAMAEIGARYDEFVAEFGPVNSAANRDSLKGDPDRPLLLSIERQDDDGRWIRGPIFVRRIVGVREIPDRVDSIEQAVGASLLAFGAVEPSYVARVLGMEQQHAEQAMVDSRLALRDPDSGGGFVSADTYLSGDVRSKLESARRAAESDSAYTANVDALERVQPDPVPFGDIKVRLGAAWIPEADIEAFVRELTSVPVKATFVAERAAWIIEEIDRDGWQSRAIPNRKTWGTDEIPAVRIIQSLANMHAPVVRTTDDTGKTSIDVRATDQVRARAALIEAAFAEWVAADPVRRRRFERIYNDRYVRFRERDYSDAEFEFVPAGMDPAWAARMRPPQRAAMRRIATGQNTLLAHATGAGKTAALIAGCMEMNNHGRCHRPALVVQNNSFSQFVATFAEIYPGVRLLTVPPASLGEGGLVELHERAAAGGYDAIVIAHSTFSRIPLAASKRRALLRDERDRLRKAHATEESSPNPNPHRLSTLRRQLSGINGRISRLANKKDYPYSFEKLGIDALFVDEAHNFKSLPPEETRLGGVLGVPVNRAKRAEDLLEKIRHMERVRGGEGATVFATATPVTNSIAELHAIMRFLDRGRLAEIGIEHFDAWASVFTGILTDREVSTDRGSVVRTRLSEFINVEDLRPMFAEVADVRTARDLGLALPRLATGKAIPVECTLSPEQKALLEHLEERVRRIGDGKVPKSVDNMFRVTTDVRKIAIDARLVDRSLPQSPDGKIARVAALAAQIWRETMADRSTQIIFCDLGVPGSATGFSVYDAIRDQLRAEGVPPDDIAFAQDARTPDEKADLYARVDRGETRILIGSSPVLGEAVNVQTRCIAAHHVDVPFAPYRLDQRDGRIERQGNRNPEIRIFHYIATSDDGKPSLDAYMWSLCARKARSIERLLSGGAGRRMEDVGRRAVACAEFLAVSLDNPAGREHMRVDAEYAEVAMEYAAHVQMRAETRKALSKDIPRLLAATGIDIARAEADAVAWEAAPATPTIQIGRRRFSDLNAAGVALLDSIRNASVRQGSEPVALGRLGPFPIVAVATRYGPAAQLLGVETPVGRSAADLGVRRSPGRLIEALSEAYRAIPGAAGRHREVRSQISERARELEARLEISFDRSEELKQLEARRRELQTELGLAGAPERIQPAAVEPERTEPSTDPVRYIRKGKAAWSVATEVGWNEPGYDLLRRVSRALGGEAEGAQQKGLSTFRFESDEGARLFGAIVDLRTGEFKPYSTDVDQDIARRIGAGRISIVELRVQFERAKATVESFRTSVRATLAGDENSVAGLSEKVEARVCTMLRRFALGHQIPETSGSLAERVGILVSRHTKADLDHMTAPKLTVAPADANPGSAAPGSVAGGGIRLVKASNQHTR